jgi:hypothetical protein
MAFTDRMKGGQFMSSNAKQQFGRGGNSSPGGGNIFNFASSTGLAVAAGHTGADAVILVFPLSPGSFDINGRTLIITASGTLANAGAKDIKMIWNPSTAVVGTTVGTGGTVVADTGSATVSSGGWQMSATIVKVGANSQMCIHQQAQLGSVVSPLLAPTVSSAVDTGTILFAVTANVVTIADVTMNFFQICAMN